MYILTESNKNVSSKMLGIVSKNSHFVHLDILDPTVWLVLQWYCLMLYNMFTTFVWE